MGDYQVGAEGLSDIAKQVFNSLCSLYAEDKGFKDLRSEEGLIYRCAGSVSILLLVTTFPDLVNSSDQWKKIVLHEFKMVREHITQNGFDATPFVNSKLTSKYFSPSAETRYHYMDSVSWVLSFALCLRLAKKRSGLEFTKEMENAVGGTTKEALEIIVEGACKEGGWGFASGCLEPDLYYSYAVSSALADLGDYVLGESSDIIEKDEEMQRYLGAELIARVQEIRASTYEWLKLKYTKNLSEALIHPSYENLPANEPQHRLLYYTFFVIDMLQVNSFDYNKDATTKEEWAKVKKSIEHGIYRSRIGVDLARNDKDWWDDTIDSELPIPWRNHAIPDKEWRNVYKGQKLSEPGLVPLILRCNALYTYLCAEGQDAKVDELYRLLLENRNEETGLWDKDGYDLLITERAIEALVEYSDYINKFAVGPTHSIGEPLQEAVSPLEEAFRDFVKDEVNSQIKKLPPMFVSSEQPTIATPEAPSEEHALLDVLISALRASNNELKGRNSPLNLAEKPSQLINELKDLLTAIARRSLLESGPKLEAKAQEEIFNKWDVQIANLMKGISNALHHNTVSDLGAIFGWLVEKYHEGKLG